MILLLMALFRPNSSSSDTITATRSIMDGNVLVSDGGTFALGFFSRGGSALRFVGIWYSKVPTKTVVWVANRENPLKGTSGVLFIDSLGNLVLASGNGSSPVWSTNVSEPIRGDSNPVVRLLDSGNLVLFQDVDEKVIRWQSFDYPTDTLLPDMKLGLNRKSGFTWSLTSWRSDDDPRPGNSTYKIDPTGYPQLFLYKDGMPHWRGGPWTGLRWSGVPEMTKKYIFNVSFMNDQNEVSIKYSVTNASIVSIMVLNSTGTVSRITWIGRDQQWVTFWFDPKEPCDYYNPCGPNGNCNPYTVDQFMCSCLPGFEPKSPGDWYLRDGTGGCLRRNGDSLCQSGEGFMKVGNLKLPDTSDAMVDMSLSLTDCEQMCLKNCSCTAYASADEREGGSGCLTWYKDLVDTRTFSNVGQDMYVRVNATELALHLEKNGGRRNKKIAVTLSVTGTLLLLLLVPVVILLKRRRATGKRTQWPATTFLSSNASPVNFTDSTQTKELDQTSNSDAGLPSFDLGFVTAATDNFSFENRLGQGGFGTVHKGTTSDGTEIAVKRLSEYSGQGNEEFKNEVNLIAKLQHRNLVRILGFCFQDHEKMLIYEYLPNGSLDTLLFDNSKRYLLDWRKRFDIATGIARGLLYLHQDSRLRIIHRDLKASNVLLDAEMRPKISDFGMARICGGDQIEGNTKRVVGTYGYMAPEYAMEGLFSVKSDVYSFGILLLEIVSGKRNSTYYHEDCSSNLIGHVWELWQEGKSMDIVDKSMGGEDQHSRKEILRCIHVGLLCVQELAADRPTMSEVLFMLGNDGFLPSPNQPAYIIRGSRVRLDNSTSDGTCSVSDATITVVEAR
ncbi:hypothetical protein MLD38_016789 [Melastoma candidum]|uniref:Uncharacterized protein n=1 Tax=Melastoma candidum TaxID=119954 RepID=A0ACB9QNK2_9MYRT|nr:hypothetical protein MLD38_016789 [Melastoma candidum]